MHSNPPRLADRFLQFFCAPHLLEEVQGDLHEEFEYQVKHVGARRARWRYWRDVLGFFQPRYIKRKSSQYPQTYLFSLNMLRNYFKIAVRNLLKHKGYSFINIFGLATGMAVAILIGLWIYDELSFNTYHKNYDRIGQVMTLINHERDGLGHNHSMPYPLSTELAINYRSHFKHLVKASWVQDYILSTGEKKLSRKGQFMDQEAPEMLSLTMIYGSWSGLQDPYSILLSASTAKALFGDIDPTNKPLRLNNKVDVKVTGVYEDLPLNTQFHSREFFGPFELWVTQNPWIKERALQDWSNHFLTIYAEIKPNDTFENVSSIIKNAELKNLANYKEQAAQNPQVFLQPMSKWHLYGFSRGVPDTEPMRMVWIVGIIGAFVLLLACINFMNLSTARSEKRAKEVGVRKAIGSVRGQLINQFFSESFLIVVLAFILALLLVLPILPWFNNIAEKQLTVLWANPYFWLFSLSFILITGLLAGSYPALYLSSFQPVKVLKGTFRVGRFASIPRQVLVVTQFTVSVTLIISTVIIVRQIQIAKNRSVGYTRDGLIMLQMKSDDFYGKYDVLRAELKKTGAVYEMSQSMGAVTNLASGNQGFEWKGGDPEEQFGTLAVTHEHGKTVDWQFVQGRDFSRDFPGDSSGLIINEAAAKLMNLEHPVGEPVRWTWWRNNKVLDYKILGVIKNMVMESPYDAIEPTVFYIKGHNGGVNFINIKINPAVSASVAIPKIEAVFKKIVPSVPFDYKFVDEEYNTKFKAEERIGKLATFFAILAIFISCLGLFGLASFVAEQRTKEIGIRKVLGATVANLWQLLSKDFVVLVIISCLIAAPISYYFMNEWLQKYTYRTEISWWIFAASAAGALTITLLTVSFQAIKAALMNPVKSLKTE
ncbi:ABC-type antimicrobial peptide transport system permease subunit [Runella defluvii]|uniref:ABC-type antimicrobial peptide transport system permease subunit n=1 Tax=Runella defluvii TaxID=370973 RepID=A0A7W6ES46_9BACT|nr:permease prefix domain 2-containing transporter [Runella defluvii]MBB3840238.1 ABC-type antimicrobial peptide transport system permease subunit [Runella defluvii]